jgi:predicted esterase
MEWTRFAQWHRLDPVAGGRPDAAVVLLHDQRQSTDTILSIAARWAATVPTTAFLAFDAIEPLGPSDLSTRAVVLDRIALDLERLTAEQRRSCQLDPGRLVLVGFGEGGTLALHLALQRGWRCAGVLAFCPRLTPLLPEIMAIGTKIRLIDSVENLHASHAELRDAVASLTERGVDARGVVLDSPLLSDESIRYGGAYLVALIASAQQHPRSGYEFRLAHATQSRLFELRGRPARRAPSATE